MSRSQDNVHTTVSAQEARDALARVAMHPLVAGAPRLAAFLKFIVETTLAGDARSIKAYTIATMALGRMETFDPAVDAIVRVEASRLRVALERYYNSDGATDAVIIELPRGRYVPRFRARGVEELALRRPFCGPDQTGPPPALDGTPESTLRTAERTLLVLCDEYRCWIEELSLNIKELSAELANARITVARSKALIEASRVRSRWLSAGRQPQRVTSVSPPLEHDPATDQNGDAMTPPERDSDH